MSGFTGYKGDLEARPCPLNPERPIVEYLTVVGNGGAGAVLQPVFLYSRQGSLAFEKTGERLLLMRCLIRSSEGFAFPFILNT